MGLIKSIFGAIFGLIGGIFKTVGSLVGLGKKSEFFMEATDAEGGSKAPVAVSAPAPAAKVEAVPTVDAKAPAPAKASTPPAPKAAPAAAPVLAAIAAEPVPTAFASSYLTSVGTTMPRRRRPGPSMSPFMDMAKQVKGK